MVFYNSKNVDLNFILESKGLPETVYNLTDLVYRKFNEQYQKNKKNSYEVIIHKNELNNLYFNELKVIIYLTNDTTENSDYNSKINNWDSVNNCFNVVTLTLYIPETKVGSIRELISHELLHSYEDYKTILNTGKSFNDKNPNKITTELETLKNVQKKFNGDIILNRITYFIYYLLGVEKRANVTQLYFELDNLNLTNEDIINGNYKELTFYKVYSNINKLSESYIDSLDENKIKLLMEYVKYSNINNLLSSDTDVFKKRLIKYFKTSSEYVINKMNKIALEYLDYLEMKKSSRNIPNKKRMMEIMDKIAEEIKSNKIL